MKLIDWLFVPLVSLSAKRLLADAEVQTAIRCSESLQQAYLRADQLDADGYHHLAAELRERADAVDMAAPGKQAIEYVEWLTGHAEESSGADGNGVAETESPVKALEGPQKRGRGRPRKSKQHESTR